MPVENEHPAWRMPCLPPKFARVCLRGEYTGRNNENSRIVTEKWRKSGWRENAAALRVRLPSHSNVDPLAESLSELSRRRRNPANEKPTTRRRNGTKLPPRGRDIVRNSKNFQKDVKTVSLCVCAKHHLYGFPKLEDSSIDLFHLSLVCQNNAGTKTPESAFEKRKESCLHFLRERIATLYFFHGRGPSREIEKWKIRKEREKPTD